jgi:predicted permease
MGFWTRLRRTLRPGRHEDEIREELQAHLELDVAGGTDPREARIRLGNTTRIGEETRAAGILEWLDSALADTRLGFRQLARAKVVAAAAVSSIAIGIGANTAIFALADAAIFKPLPVPEAESLRLVEWTNRGFPPGAENVNGELRDLSGGRLRGSSVPAWLYRRLAAGPHGFDALVGVGAYPEGASVSVGGRPAEAVGLQYVSANFLEGLRVPPLLGRPFTRDDDRVGAEPVVVVSHRFWISRLGGRSDALADVLVNGVPARVVGVAPPGFFGVRMGQWPDVYAPLAAKVAFQPSPGAARGEQDANWWVRIIARVAPGVPEAEATRQLALLLRTALMAERAELAPGQVPELVTAPGRRGSEAISVSDTDALRILMLLVGPLLLLVCANVANLLLARAVARRRESAMRLALGAPRSRLFRQHMLESGVYAALGGAAGLGLGAVASEALHALFQSGRDASFAFDLRLDWRVAAAAAGLTFLSVLLFGIVPALHAARAGVGEALHAHTRSIVSGGLRLPRLLVSLQVALSLAAVSAAGLLGRSLHNLRTVEVGFQSESLAYASVAPGRAGYARDQLGEYLERARQELAAIPGVVSVSPVATRPLSGGGNNGRVHLPGRPWSDAHRANLNAVGEGFFETLGMPLVAGRPIESRDLQPDASGVVVDALFARRFFGNQSPLGRRFGMSPKEDARYEVVGVVGDSRYNNLRGAPVPTVYQPYRPGGPIHLAIRSSLAPSALGAAVRRAVSAVDPAVPLLELHTQAALIDRLLRTERLLGALSGALGAVALIVSGVGLFGLLAYAVARRTGEIGLRMSFGARAGDVVSMVLRDALRMLAAGCLLGAPCAWALGVLLQSTLFRLEPLDPRTALFSLAVLATVALLAAVLPAWRAARVDPMTALRQD